MNKADIDALCTALETKEDSIAQQAALVIRGQRLALHRMYQFWYGPRPLSGWPYNEDGDISALELLTNALDGQFEK